MVIGYKKIVKKKFLVGNDDIPFNNVEFYIRESSEMIRRNVLTLKKYLGLIT